VKVLYWNIASLRKKEEEFWDYVRQFEIVVGLIETWVEEAELGKNIKVVTYRIQMGMSRGGKTRKEKELQGEYIITGLTLGIKKREKKKERKKDVWKKRIYI
jgi:hypothetical protein